MPVRRFISDCPPTDGKVWVQGDELYHLKNVNRAKPGDPVEVINGKGTLYLGNIKEITHLKAIVEVQEEQNIPELSPRLIVAPSLIKKKAMNLMIEKLSEVGVDEIRPIIFAHTDERFHESMLSRWDKITKQSLKINKRLWSTRLYPPITINELVEFGKGIKTRIMLDAKGQWDLKGELSQTALLVIGPPGDFRVEERDLFMDNGFFQYKINENILKTETAAISAAAIFMKNQL
jgi:16S rRNA (uracil1498-N3)-methyltransferase